MDGIYLFVCIAYSAHYVAHFSAADPAVFGSLGGDVQSKTFLTKC